MTIVEGPDMAWAARVSEQEVNSVVPVTEEEPKAFIGDKMNEVGDSGLC